jgi:ligand-binding sensor domain-containing protein
MRRLCKLHFTKKKTHMNKPLKLIHLILILTLIFSCVEKQSPQKESGKSVFVNLSESDSLNFNYGIQAIFQDSKGNYWLGSSQEGVCLFDGEKFTYFTVHNGLSDNQIRSIQEDQNGNIWFGTAKGVCSYDGKMMTNHTPTNRLPINNSSSEWAKTANDLWFNAGNSNGVYRYDGQKLHYLMFPKTKLSNPNNVYHATDFSKGKNNQIWIATYAGVFGYNGKNFTIINDENLGFDENAPLHIRSILEDSKGNLWIGNNGIGVLLNNGDTTINFSEKNGLIHFNSSRKGDPSPVGTLEHVFAIKEDSQGNIWFGDRDTGAWKFDGKTMTNYVVDAKISTQMIYDIAEDNDKNLLFAMGKGGVYKFNGNSFDKMF